jgi:pimeloyl-ACP methyl ester carboxylesterase
VAGLVLVAPGGFAAPNALTRLACRSLGRPAVARFAAAPLARLYLRRRNDVTRRALRQAAATGRDPQRRAVFAAVWRSFLHPEHDLRDMPPPPAPILLTWGRWDPVAIAPTDGRRAARCLGVKISTFACGHEPYAEVPDNWLGVVGTFLASVEGPGGWSPPPRAPGKTA